MIIKFTTDAPYIRAFFNWLKRRSGRRKLLSMDKCKTLARLIALTLLVAAPAQAFTEVRDQRGELSPVIVTETWGEEDPMILEVHGVAGKVSAMNVTVEKVKPRKIVKPRPTTFLVEQPKPHKSVLIPMINYPERMGSAPEPKPEKRGLVGPSMGFARGEDPYIYTHRAGTHMVTKKLKPNRTVWG